MPNRCIEFLRHHLKAYLKANDDSIMSIANSIGVVYQRLYRFQDDELKNLTFYEAKCIARFLKPDGWERMLEEGYPAEAKDLKTTDELPGPDLIRALQAMVRTSLATEVFIFATEKPNVCAEDIVREFGNRGLQVVQDLIKNGAIIEDQAGRYLAGIKTQLAVPDEFLQPIYRNYSEITDMEDSGHLIRLYSRGLNLIGLKRVYGIMAETSAALTEAFNDPDCAGDQIYLTTLQCGRMNGRNRETSV